MNLVNTLPFPRMIVRVGRDRLHTRTIDRFLAALVWKLGWAEAHERALIERVVAKGMIAIDV
jgi:hypothetical protein